MLLLLLLERIVLEWVDARLAGLLIPQHHLLLLSIQAHLAHLLLLLLQGRHLLLLLLLVHRVMVTRLQGLEHSGRWLLMLLLLLSSSWTEQGLLVVVHVELIIAVQGLRVVHRPAGQLSSRLVRRVEHHGVGSWCRVGGAKFIARLLIVGVASREEGGLVRGGSRGVPRRVGAPETYSKRRAFRFK